MQAETKQSTFYLDPQLHRALRMKSAETSISMSELVNQAIRRSLGEDTEDLIAFEQRKSEPLISYEDMLKELKNNGKL